MMNEDVGYNKSDKNHDEDLSIPFTFERHEFSRSKKVVQFKMGTIYHYERSLPISECWYNDTDYLRFQYDFMMEKKYKTFP